MNLRFGPETLGNLEEGSAREWLVSDGIGGFAMGSVAGMRTRRYHGLLIAAVNGPADRMLGLVGLDPTLVVGDRRFRLATDDWNGATIDPTGHRYLASFWLQDGLPCWRWQIGDIVLERTLAMGDRRSCVGVVHRLVRADQAVRLEITPLCTWRNAHGERFGNGSPAVTSTVDGFVFEDAYRVAGPGWTPGGAWYRGVRAREEAARGLNDLEDVWAAGTFAAPLGVGDLLEITAAAAPYEQALPRASQLVAAARARAAEVIRQAAGDDGIDGQLALAADQFVITTADGPTAVAGYPWFGEWSRDLMTSYEGLFLSTNRWDEGRAALLRAAATIDEGMLANTADTGTLEYNTADGTLWFVHAVGRHVAVTGDKDLAGAVLGPLEEIVQHHVAGTRYGIGIDPLDGLLRQGADGWALTWMDARVDGTPITPRAGKAVEIAALWVNALQVVTALGSVVGGRRADWTSLVGRARNAFAARFVRTDGGGLYDVVDGPASDDGSVRPNQLLAVALPDPAEPLLSPAAARSAVDACRRSLLTPLGLRSLSPDHPAYRGLHRGRPDERDAAYHQGTVWPWLIGPYADAAMRTGVSTDGILDGLEAHLGDWGIGSVSETADGDAPHGATGAPFQAWSVAEVLRIRRRLQSDLP